MDDEDNQNQPDVIFMIKFSDVICLDSDSKRTNQDGSSTDNVLMINVQKQ